MGITVIWLFPDKKEQLIKPFAILPAMDYVMTQVSF